MKGHRMKNRFLLLRWVLLLPVVLCGAPSAWAAGAFLTLENGTPLLWKNNTVFYSLETGGLRGSDAGEEERPGSSSSGSSGGCSLDKGASKALTVSAGEFQNMVRSAVQVWKDAAGPDLVVTEGPSLGENVNFANAENFLAGDFPATGDVSKVDVNKCYSSSDNTGCTNAIVSDPNGLITEAILGQCSRFGTFGVTSLFPKTNADGSIADSALKFAQMIINGTCLEPAEKGSDSFDCPNSECPKEMSVADIQSVITHEMGHFLGMDHSLVNKVEDSKCQKGGLEGSCNWEALPTMIGLYRPFANLHTLTLDDIAGIRRYYSSAAKSASGGMCTIKGTVYKSTARASGKSAGLEWRCAEVVAKKDGSDLNAAGFVSGSEAARTKSDGSQSDCNTGSAGCGAFEIRGLPAGTYTMGVHDFSSDDNPAFGGEDWIDFNVEPCHPVLASNSFNDNDPAKEPPALPVEVKVTCPAGGGVQTVDLYTN